MKRLLFLLSILSVYSCSAIEKPILPSALPLCVKEFVNLHFNGRSIVYAERESFGRVLYDITLDDGTEISFDKRCD